MNSARALILSGFVVVFFFVLAVKLFNIQVADHEHFKYLADRQQNKRVPIPSERGQIVDRNGIVLAYTKNDVSYYIDLRMADKKDREIIAAKFSSVFGEPESHFRNIIDKGSKNTYLIKKASYEKAVRLNNFNRDCLKREDDFTRVYPLGPVGSHIIGYTNSKSIGVAGIEKQYDEYLKGKEGYRFEECNVLGETVEVLEDLSCAAEPGYKVILTINSTYQTILEQELEKGLKYYNAESASGIIMDPATGEILALADAPSFDPSNPLLVSSGKARNRSIVDTYEPGSTLKALSMSVLLDNNKVGENEVITTENGSYKYFGEVIKDSHPFTSLTVKEILLESSNIGMTKLSGRLDKEIFYKYYRDFGFGNKTGIDLPYENEGMLKKPDNFKKSTQARMSFGYEISVTPLQLITAFCSLINGGSLYKPFIVKKILNDAGDIVIKNEISLVRNVISKKTSSVIVDWMTDVVEKGTGQFARSSLVKIGGKTGTSHKYDPAQKKYSEENFNSSFIGFFPAESPRLVCLILFNSPRTETFGGKVAAPVFKSVAERIVETDTNILKNKKESDNSNGPKDFIASLNTGENSDRIRTFNYSEKVKNDTETAQKNINKGTMPDLMHYPLSKAINTLAELGLKYKIKGSGKVYWQSIEPGSKINPGQICEISCRNEGNKSSINLN